MALLVVTGPPCSGRSTHAAAIERYLSERLGTSELESVVVVRDDDVHASRSVYDKSRARAAYLSSVRRAVSPTRVVIADGGAGTHIKGFRYELCLDELLLRFEEPRPEMRWHRPLFVVATTLADGQPDTAPLPLEDIHAALTQAKAPAPVAVTAPRHMTADNHLEVVDRVTHQVVGALNDAREFAGNGKITLAMPPGFPPPAIEISLDKALPPPARLQTLRRQFVRLYADKAPDATSAAAREWQIARTFADWLSGSLA
ncbi:kti12, chromatin associated [Malassezia cuniculi]|uniref:Kti12, chromatin associated n=1 Tax=Malassezia cuniculi TaxID=948313 RepID=A0AAF0J7V7_9BASI|nr:kti12, chromatin associated [Malassezia cuniculi]